ncbi:MAG: endolytic transglycosylase MltG [Sulfurovum sp.]|nr:endolytic transglycosylase MltG [Sulfurovum sp.]
MKPVWLISIVLAFFIALTLYMTSIIETKKTLHIPQGSIGSIISQLTKEGYDVGIIDNIALRFIGTPKSGWLDIGESKLSRMDFLHKLTSSKTMIHKVTLIPGETTYIFFQNLAKKLKLNPTLLQSEYDAHSPYPEAGIYADTYHVPYGIDEKNLISYLVNISNNKHKKISEDANGDYNQTKWLHTLTVASIIQKEAASNEEMPLIASVIYNRLKKNMRLQMDGTLNYGKYSHIKVTPQRIKDDNSTFNTYKYKGLPPSPIGSVSTHAINAALYPKETNYLYFMRNKDGVHDFTDTFRKHRENIERVK